LAAALSRAAYIFPSHKATEASLELEHSKNHRELLCHFLLDKAAFQNTIASLPLVTYEAGETVIAGGSLTGKLLILRTGAVVITKDGSELANVAESGAVFGELSILLDQPHTADRRALETSQFHVADAATLLANPIAAMYVGTILASRLSTANQALIQLKT
jgi:CRP-like cAMP-binding protein